METLRWYSGVQFGWLNAVDVRIVFSIVRPPADARASSCEPSAHQHSGHDQIILDSESHWCDSQSDVITLVIVTPWGFESHICSCKPWCKIYITVMDALYVQKTREIARQCKVIIIDPLRFMKSLAILPFQYTLCMLILAGMSQK